MATDEKAIITISDADDDAQTQAAASSMQKKSKEGKHFSHSRAAASKNDNKNKTKSVYSDKKGVVGDTISADSNQEKTTADKYGDTRKVKTKQILTEENEIGGENAETAQTDKIAPKNKKKKKRKIVWENVFRYNVDQSVGLSKEQVQARTEGELTNRLFDKRGKSVLQIFVSNTFTFFNLLYLCIAVVLMIYRQWTQISFLVVAFCNTAIAIFQEIRSKKSLEKLKLVNTFKATVLRDGEEVTVDVNDVVLDDIIFFKNGDQICADSIVVSGGLEVNESMLTGESESVVKNVGDMLFAGSFVVSGRCKARVDSIAEYNYIENLTNKAVKYQKPRSQMLRSLRIILKIVAIIIVPLGVFLGITNFNVALETMPQSEAIVEAMRKTAGSLVGMIPAGPFLLTSMTLAVSVFRLSKRKTMVQELYCIEMLARVDVLCLDKTGTLTDGTMKVVDCVDFNNASRFSLEDIIGSLNSALKDDNMTSEALKKRFGKKSVLKPTCVVPFSSKRKFSAVSFENEGTFFLGAPEFILNGKNQRVEAQVKNFASQGYRVLMLAQSASMILEQNGESKLPTVRRPIALIVIEDRIRPDAKETIEWFCKNGVAIKIISGDNPVTASFIAEKVGVPNFQRYISLEGMSDKEIEEVATAYTVFGRVTPDQKCVLVKALKAKGKTVAMTGDGVNDILAMRESDCAVAMAAGSEAARNASHLVLLDNNFSSMPSVVAEGRQVVNNIQAASSMYFMKTIYTIALNIFVLIANYAFAVSVGYPFTSANVMLLEIFIVGMPTFVLALQKNTEIIKGKFLPNILKRCLPASITFFVGTIALFLVYRSTLSGVDSWLGSAIEYSHFSTIAIYTLTFASFYALYFACSPVNGWRMLVLCASLLLTLLCIFVPFTHQFFGFGELTGQELLLTLVAILASFPVMWGLNKLFSRSIKKCQKQS